MAESNHAASADSHDVIRVTGGRENNLKNVNLEIPKRRLTVFTSGIFTLQFFPCWDLTTADCRSRFRGSTSV